MKNCPDCNGTGYEPEVCKVCGAKPREFGAIEHGRGCYTQSADGGGTSYAEDCPCCRGSGVVVGEPRGHDEAGNPLFVQWRCNCSFERASNVVLAKNDELYRRLTDHEAQELK